MSISKPIERLLGKAEAGTALTRDDILALLKLPGDYSPDLFAAANRVRRKEVGDEIFLRGIIEFSNICERNCLYCGLRKSNDRLSRYRMTDDEILATAREIAKIRVPTVVLQSGEDSFYSTDRICRMVERIKNETGLIITLSIGEKNAADYQAFAQS
ncbi:MAG: [FeFe] hydrogenase H-cluster radical SAM maturase HydE, partial [Deltaproteobacteria bacterium HGW-Deltaproteobacteria-7]